MSEPGVLPMSSLFFGSSARRTGSWIMQQICPTVQALLSAHSQALPLPALNVDPAGAWATQRLSLPSLPFAQKPGPVALLSVLQHSWMLLHVGAASVPPASMNAQRKPPELSRRTGLLLQSTPPSPPSGSTLPSVP